MIKKVIGMRRKFEMYDVAMMNEPEDIINNKAEFVSDFENIEQAKGFAIGILEYSDKWTYTCVIKNKYEVDMDGEKIVDSDIVFEAMVEDDDYWIDSNEENEHNIKFS